MRRAILGMIGLSLGLCLAAFWPAPRVHAQDCPEGETQVYVVQGGDTLSLIAERVYGDAARWSVIQKANPEIIGAGAANIRVGMQLRLPCLAAGASAPTRAAGGVLTLLSAGDYAPFTGRDLPGGGLVTQIALAALGAGAPGRPATVQWIEDRAAHLDPLLSEGLMDMGFAWTRPVCEADTPDAMCAAFVFSEPVFEMLMVLFVRPEDAGAAAAWAEGDMAGRVICRPRGFALHDLDRADRRWIAEGRITLRQPGTHAACFEQLLRGEVDAVAVDEFSGRAALRAAGLGGQVTALTSQPLSIEQLHVIAPRVAPGATGLISAFDSGLAQIRGNGRYQEILETHLGQFWAAAL